MTEREALSNAIYLYWEDGLNPDEIKSHLYESCGQSPHSIRKIMSYLGEAIAKFDTDAGAAYVDERLGT